MAPPLKNTLIQVYNVFVYCIWNLLVGMPIKLPTMIQGSHRVPSQMTIIVDSKIFEHIPVVKHNNIKATINIATYNKLREWLLDNLPPAIYAYIFKGIYRNQQEEMVKNICAEFDMNMLNKICDMVLRTIQRNLIITIPANDLNSKWDNRPIDVNKYHKYYVTSRSAYYHKLATNLVTEDFISELALYKANATKGADFLKAICVKNLPAKLHIRNLNCTYFIDDLLPHIILDIDEWKKSAIDGPYFKKIITLNEKIKSLDGNIFDGKYIADNIESGNVQFTNWLDSVPDTFDEDGDTMFVIHCEFIIENNKFRIELNMQNYTI